MQVSIAFAHKNCVFVISTEINENQLVEKINGSSLRTIDFFVTSFSNVPLQTFLLLYIYIYIYIHPLTDA